MKAELSLKNKYWISKHRYYELKHFCMQYNEWKRILYFLTPKLPQVETSIKQNNISDPTSTVAIRRAYFKSLIELVEKSAYETDPELSNYILIGATEDYGYTYMKTKLNIPCSKDTYYARLRKFYWIISQSR